MRKWTWLLVLIVALFLFAMPALGSDIGPPGQVTVEQNKEPLPVSPAIQISEVSGPEFVAELSLGNTDIPQGISLVAADEAVKPVSPRLWQTKGGIVLQRSSMNSNRIRA